MARMTALRFSIALVLMTMFADCDAIHRITPSDVPTSLLPFPTRLYYEECFYWLYCQCDLEVTSGGTGTPLTCVRLTKSIENTAIIHLSVAEGRCQEDNHNHNYTAVWPTAGGYGPNIYLRSEDNKLVLTLNDRPQYKLSIPMSGNAQGFTIVRLTQATVSIADVKVVGRCLSLTGTKTDLQVQESDVILVKAKPSTAEVEIRALPFSEIGCEKLGVYIGKYQVQEQGWVRLELHLPKEEHSNINLTVNNQLVVPIPVSNHRCTGKEWFHISMIGADAIVNCNPQIAQNASKICACKVGTCDTCVWVTAVLIAVLVLLVAVSVVVAYLSYKKKDEDNSSAFLLIETNKCI